MNHIRYSSLAAALAIGLGGLASAQNQSQSQSQSPQQHRSFQSSEHGQRAMRDMSALDRDRDQRVSQDEARSDPNLVAAWAEIDVSRDGSVDATEYYLYAAQRRIGELEGTSQAQARSAQPGSAQSSSSQSSSGQSSAQSARAGQPSTQTQSSTRQSNAGDQDIDVAQADRPGSSQQSQNRASDTSSRSAGEQPSFDEADRNNDGRIDRQEYESARL